METGQAVEAAGAEAEGVAMGSDRRGTDSLHALVSCFSLSAAKMSKNGSGLEAACGSGWGSVVMGCGCGGGAGGGVETWGETGAGVGA